MRLIYICLILLATGRVWGTEFAVSPMLIDFNSRPGASEPFEISIAGKQSGKITLSIYAMDQQESGHMSFIESTFDPSQHKAVSWIRFERNHYEISRNQTTVIRGVVQIPRNEKGTYLAAVMIEEAAGPSASNISIKVRYAVILNINISRPSGRLTTVFDNLSLIERDGATYVVGYFTNKNPFMGMLDSQVQIRGQDRRLVARLPLRTESAWQRGDDASRVYPGARVEVFARLESVVKTGDYSLLVRNRLSGRSLPVYRQQLAYRSELGNEPVNFEALQISPERIVISPRRSGLSLTSVSVSNNLSQPVSIVLPDGRDLDRGIERFEFIPNRIVLKPGMRRRVLLKQMHMQNFDFPGRKYVLTATFESGDQQDLVVSTFPEES